MAFIRVVIRLALALLLVHASSGCRGDNTPQGSETNWLAACSIDTECASGSCVCGVCTSTCSDDATCSGGPSPAHCSVAGQVAYQEQCGAAAGPPSGICLPTCTSDNTCGDGQRCDDGVCHFHFLAPLDGSSPESSAAHDAKTGGISDADAGCSAPNVLAYVTAGCGAEARPVCGSGTVDACAAYACSCTGHTIFGCGEYVEPYAHLGPCSDGQAPDVSLGDDGAHDAKDGGDGDADASTMDGCSAPNVLRYQTAGCAAEAHPVCGSAVGDACLGHACSCTGHTIDGCDYYPEPYTHLGPCEEAGSDL